MRPLSILVVVLALGLAIFTTSAFSVKQWDQALVLEFGQAKRIENKWGAETDAGLKFKKPWEKVVTLDRRNLEMDLAPVELLASDQERMVVDAFVRYRIIDGVRYYESLRNEQGARQKLQSVMDSTLRDVLGRVDTSEIISGRRGELMSEIQSVTNAVAAKEGFGVEIIDVRIMRADLPKANAEKVFMRMKTEREQRAAQIRAEGEKRSREIRATAKKTAVVTVAKAKEQAEIIKGKGDAERNATYAKAYNLDPEFFSFYRSMQAYKTGLSKGTTYVLSPEGDFLGYLDSQKGDRR